MLFSTNKSGGDKMRNASGHQCKVKMSSSEKKVNKKKYDISSIKRVTKKSQQVSSCSRAKQLQRNVQKSVLAFHRSPALSSPLSITRFYIFTV